MVRSEGELITDEEAGKIIRFADFDGDGQVSQHEYVKMKLGEMDEELYDEVRRGVAGDDDEMRRAVPL